MKKILIATALVIAFISFAFQSNTLLTEAKMTIRQADTDVNNTSSAHNKQLEQQKIEDALRSLETNPAGVKYAQFIKDNGIKVVWGRPKDCDGANFCSTGHKIIMNRDWAGESPELLSGYIVHETVHQMTPAKEGSSLYEEYRAYEAEDQVREAIKENKGFNLQKSGYQQKNLNPDIDPSNATELEGWFIDNGLYDAYSNLPDYPPGKSFTLGQN